MNTSNDLLVAVPCFVCHLLSGYFDMSFQVQTSDRYLCPEDVQRRPRSREHDCNCICTNLPVERRSKRVSWQLGSCALLIAFAFSLAQGAKDIW